MVTNSYNRQEWGRPLTNLVFINCIPQVRANPNSYGTLDVIKTRLPSDIDADIIIIHYCTHIYTDSETKIYNHNLFLEECKEKNLFL